MIALLAIALSGAGLVAAARLRVSRAAFVALSLALGAGTWSLTYAGALMAFGPAARTPKDLLLAVAGAGLLIRAVRRGQTKFTSARQSELSGPVAPRWLQTLLGAACVLAAALVVEHVMRFPDGGWDAWMIWNLRARFLARAGEGFRAAFSPDLLFWAHQDYPWMVPGLVAQEFLVLRSETFWIPALNALALAALAAGVLGTGVATLRGRLWGACAALALVSTPCFVSFTANQQSDVPMGAFLVTACALLALALEGRGSFALAGFALGLAAWTKNEGLLYSACIFAALATRGRFRELLRTVAGWLPAAAVLASFKLFYAHTSDLSGFSTPADFVARATDAHRWAELAAASLRRVVYFQDFALWPLAALAALVLVVRRLPSRAAPQIIGNALAFAMLLWVPMYILQPHPLLWFFRASIDRLFTHVWPSLLLATALALAQDPARARADT